MHIQIAGQCHFFQRRLCWMLSSIHQQCIPGDLHLSTSLAHMEGTGNPSTTEVIDYFTEVGMDIRSVPYENEDEFQYRGWTRNRQLEECDADWIMFVDCDMVYPVDFFSTMYHLLKTPEYKDNPHCLHSARFSTTLNETEDMVNSYKYPCLIDDPHTQTSYLPGKMKSNIGAGYCQLVNVKILKESDNPYYCEPGKKVDNSWSKYNKCKSDQHFRKRLGREKIPLPTQFHLQHIRDNEVGYHIEVQR